MKKLLLLFGLLAGAFWSVPASAQYAPCIGVGGVNTVPQTGVSCASEPSYPTYTNMTVGLSPTTAPTDIACLTGSATRVVRVQAVRISGTATTALVLPVSLTKHALADSAGTAAPQGLITATGNMSAYAADPNVVSPTAVSSAYQSGNPTINDTLPGVIDTANLILTTTSTLTGTTPYTLFDYQERNFEQAPILRSATQQVCVNLNATNVNAGSLNITFKWTEAAQ